MKRKKNNNLILVNVGNKKHYFTSANRAGDFLGLGNNSIMWAIMHHNELSNNNGDIITVEMVDGSNILWKDINRI